MKSRSSLLLVAVLLAASPVWAQGESARYLIGFQPRTGAAERDAALSRLGAAAVEAFDELDLVVAETADASSVRSLTDAELAGLRISLIEEDAERNWLVGAEAGFMAMPLEAWSGARTGIPRFERAAPPADALPPGVDAAEVPWGIRRVNAPAAWAISDGRGARVAVVDTGIDGAHPDLRVSGGYNAIDPKKPFFDDNAHGTHVAGTMAAKRDGRGVVGVAPGAELFAVKVLDGSGSGRVSSIIRGLVWCAKNDIHVANMSLGSPVGSVFLRLAVKYAAKKGVALVAAAGNASGSVGYPAAYPETIAVSASDDQDRLASFSNRGPRVDFVAPGVGVLSTIPNGGYDRFNGTSMAAPHVAGLAALAVSRGARRLDGVRAALERGARGIGLRPHEEGRGMIDAAALVR